jgi:endoglucanase
MKIKFLSSAILLAFQAVYAQHDYSKALHLTTYFMGAQRCGDTKSWIHPEGGCHLTDGQKEGVDLTGGWHDCGDYIKFHVTGPYTALVLLYGYDNYPEAYPDDYSSAFSAPPANGIPDILDEVKVETDYLIKAIQGTTVYWQVGSGPDHNSFTDPITNSGEKLYGGSNVRTVFSTTEGRSNALGNSAAALALMSILYKPYDAAYAQKCLQAAVGYYDVGRKNPKGTADAADGFYGFMGGSNFRDELGMAAILLHRATGTAQYLEDAKTYAAALSRSASFMYADVTPLLFLELYKKTKEKPWLDNVGSAVSGKSLASCGYHHATNWGSMRDAGNAAMLAALYHQYSGNAAAYTFAKANVDFILGSHNAFANVPKNFSFLIGYDVLGGGYPKYPHHAPAFGQSTNAWDLFTREDRTPGTVPFKYELKGGLAGGPESSCGNFHDKVGNYVSSEYCSYYNAAFTGAVAYVRKKEGNLSIRVNGNAIAPPVAPTPWFTHGFAVLRNVHPELRGVLVHDPSGKVLWRQEGTPETTNGELRIDFRKYPSGVYFANLLLPGGRQSIRIVK